MHLLALPAGAPRFEQWRVVHGVEKGERRRCGRVCYVVHYDSCQWPTEEELGEQHVLSISPQEGPRAGQR